MFTFRHLASLAAAWIFLPETAFAQVVINEIHYDEDDPTIHSEYIELHNPGTQPVDLSGCYFSEGPALTFPAGTTVAPGGFVVVCEDPAVLQTKWSVGGAGVFNWNAGVVPPVFGQLKNSGETITLRSAAGSKLDEVDYAKGFPWPTVGDPPNYSIELINPLLDNSLGGNWRRSDASGGGSPAVNYVPLGSSAWHYRKALSEASTPATAWREVGFPEDATWLTSAGGAPFGFGEVVDTVLTDMTPDPAAVPPAPGYTSVYLRHTFQLTGPVPGQIKLRVFNDDGFVAWINGTEVARFGPTAGAAVAYNDFAERNHEFGVVDEIILTAPNAILNIGTPAAPGQNVLCIHALNTSLDSSDFYIDAELGFAGSSSAAAPTPRALNSVMAANAPPAVRQVEHTPVVPLPLPEWPPSGQPVRITSRITDPDGMGVVSLSWQVVEPGDYIRLGDPRYAAAASWSAMAMTDDGQAGDEVAGDGLYSAILPASVQVHRRLIRYRITAADALGAGVRAPYLDDPQPNFAYYVYDALPDYTAKPTSSTAAVTYPASLLATLPAYHLITTTAQHGDAQNVPVIQPNGSTRAPTAGTYTHSLYLWHGALCYDGKVYDHIRYRARGGVWRFAMGKNMWKFDFNKGHDFQARDNYGKKYDQQWKKLNFSSCIQQGDFNHRGEQGLFESVGFRLFQLTGMPAENTHFVHFRIVSRPSETNASPSNQFDDDFQGLYLGIEQQDGQFLDEHDLPDGNLYKMESGTGELNHTGSIGPKNKSDLNAFQAYGNTEAWWRANCDLPNYYNYRAIVDSIHHYDIGDGKNYFYYRNPLTAKWTVLPWDLDLTWADNMYRSDTGIAGLSPSGNPTEPFFSRVFGTSQAGNGPIPVLRQELRNRVREIQDLLFNAEQTGMLIDEMASFIYQPGQPSFVDADRAMWDFNPIMVSGNVNSSKSGQGRFYQSAVNSPATPENEAAKFTGMMVKMKNYITSRRNVIASQVLTAAEEALVPVTPVLSRSGTGPIPVNALSFTPGAFTGKAGATFAGLKWRIAESTDPAAPGYLPYNRSTRRAYEMENAWESPVISPMPASLTAPAIAARPGGAYRARVKFLDSTGRWSHWSAPVSFTASEPDVSIYLQSLVITKVYYHPAAPTPAEAAIVADPEAYEWIELMNVGPVTLDLTPVRFTKGIDFNFAGSAVTSLAPGQRVIVVRNLAAFTARYGNSPGGTPVAGAWQDSDALSNSGEEIKLSYGAGTAIREFSYDDNSPWPDGADGSGYGLVLMNPATLPDPANAANWRLSTTTMASPGQSDRLSYAAWAAPFNNIAADDDSDLDGHINLVEYASGTPPLANNPLPLLTPGQITIQGIAYAAVTFRTRLGADDAVVLPQFTTNLQNWPNPPVGFQRVSVTGQPDGTAVETWRSQTPLGQQSGAWFRLKISLLP